MEKHILKNITDPDTKFFNYDILGLEPIVLLPCCIGNKFTGDKCFIKFVIAIHKDKYLLITDLPNVHRGQYDQFYLFPFPFSFLFFWVFFRATPV